MPTTDEAKLIISLEARLSKYEREMKRATQISSATARKIESDFSKLDRSMGRIGTGMKSFVGGFAGAFGAQQLAQIVRQVSAAGDAIGDLAEQTGATVESIQILRYAAVQTGSSVEQMDTALAKFAVGLGEAARGGGDLKKMLDANGISLEDAAGNARSFNDILNDVVGLVKDAKNQFAALEVVTTAFGAKNDELVTTFRGGKEGLAAWGKELQKFGDTIDDEGIAALSKLDAKFNATTKAMENALARLVIATGPLIDKILDEVIQFANTLGEIADTIDLLFKGEFAAAGQLAAHGRESAATQVARELTTNAENLLAVEQELKVVQDQLIAGSAGRYSAQLQAQERALLNQKNLLEVEQKRLQAQREAIRLQSTHPSATGPIGPFAPAGATTVIPPAGAGGGKTAAELAAGLIAEVEGFVSKAFWDTNAFRVGFSSDTMTGATGEVTRTTAESVSTVADAWRDLNRRIAEAQVTLIEKLGAEAYNRLTEGEKAALTSVLYHHGAGGFPSSLVTAAQSGAPGAVAAGIEALPGFRSRHLREASVAMGGDIKAYENLLAADEKAAKAAADAAEKAAEEREKAAKDYQAILDARTEALGITNTEIELFGQGNQKLDEALILQQEMNRLKELGLENDAEAVRLAQEYAKTQAAGSAQLVTLEETQEANIERLDAMRDLSSDVFGGIISDLRAGASAGEIFANVLDKIIAKLGDMAVNMLTTALFGAQGTAQTGLLGGLLGGLIPGRQHGGAVEAGSPYVVGETQPELFVPNVSGRIMPSVPRGLGAASASIINGQLRGVIDINPSPLFMTSVAQTSASMIAANNRRLPSYLADRQRRGI